MEATHLCIFKLTSGDYKSPPEFKMLHSANLLFNHTKIFIGTSEKPLLLSLVLGFASQNLQAIISISSVGVRESKFASNYIHIKLEVAPLYAKCVSG